MINNEGRCERQCIDLYCVRINNLVRKYMTLMYKNIKKNDLNTDGMYHYCNNET